MTGRRVNKWHVGAVVFALCLCIPTFVLSAKEKVDAPTPKIELVNVGTFWLPDISTIGEEVAPEPLGACCGPFGILACEDNTGHTWCITPKPNGAGGIWMGAGSVCVPGLCATPVREVTWGAIKALYR